ncbi:hypothetical protein LA080_009110 [Diaporthe eres]|nr:hypothetical protein LA080_009110 [Diaporthe eres]
MLRSILLRVLEKLPDLQDVLDGTQLVPQDQNGSAVWKLDVLQRLFSTAVSRLNKRRVICFINALDDCNEDEMLHKAAGVFMWVILVVDILNKEFEKGRIFAVKARLQEIPDQLGELFKDMLRRDNDNMAELLLCIHTDDMGRFVLSSSKGLAEVTRYKRRTVQFIHESVRDFLIKDNGLCDLWHELGEDFESLSHDRLKQCCLAYVSIVKSGYLPSSSSPTSTTLPRASSDKAKALRESVSAKFPFLEYAVRQVFYHANEAAAGLQQSAFLEQFPLQAWIDLDNLFEKHQSRRHTSSATFLYLFAENNWTRLVATQLGRDPQTNLGELYQYPLFVAIASGHRNAAEVISQHCMDSESDIPLQILRGPFPMVPKDHTLLSWAAQKTDEGVMKLLLDTGTVDVNMRDQFEDTALSCAARNGHEGIVRLLFNTGKAHIDMEDQRGMILLLQAVQRGDEGGMTVNMKDGDRQKLLHKAVASGYKKIVQLLLDTNGVDPNAKDKIGRTPLLQAVQTAQTPKEAQIQPHDSLEKSVGGDLTNDWIQSFSFRKQGRNGKKPLMHQDEIVQLLLETGRVDPDAKDRNRRTPLSWAAQIGHEKIVQLLLDTDQVDPDAKGNDRKTPLLWAALGGHETIDD